MALKDWYVRVRLRGYVHLNNTVLFLYAVASSDSSVSNLGDLGDGCRRDDGSWGLFP